MYVFKPTWLYVKQHNQTGLKYFGKTVRNPYKYKGSGKKWVAHINKHGNDVTTIWVELFTDQNLIREFALKFSEENQIVESNDWANLKPEDGLWGGSAKGTNAGKVRTEEHCRKISEKAKGRKHSSETIMLMSLQRKGRQLAEETKQKIGKANKGKVRNPVSDATRNKMSLARAGRSLSNETKAKISARLTGQKRDDAFKEKCKNRRSNRIGIPHTSETKLKMSLAAKKRSVAKNNKNLQCGEELSKK